MKHVFNYQRTRWLGLWAGAVACCCLSAGCRSRREVAFEPTQTFAPVSTQIEYPDACVQPASATIGEEPIAPHTVREPEPTEVWPLSLDEVVRITLANSKVMREIGGRVVQTPQTMSSVYDPSLQITNPLIGEEAALSAFDAQFQSSLLLGRDDRSFNNALFAGAGFNRVASSLTTETGNFLAEVNKRSAAGTYMAFRNVTVRTSRNSILELFPSYYDTAFEAEFRQPLLRGAGVGYNRIAGPNTTFGNYNGILIARVRTDIALADFERSVRTLMEDVQQTYWQLYYAYRNLDARIAARDAALESWRNAKTQLDIGAGNILDESLTREQYFQFQTQVADSLSGVGTDTSTSPTRIGVYTLERQLRLLMGIDVNDGRLIRPSDEPTKAEVMFDWNEAVDLAMFRRVELRRQQWTIKQREMELLAARNRLLVEFDLVGLYRRRGFGDQLFGARNVENGSAFRDLYNGSLDGWQIGAQVSTPIGNRIGHVAVRNAQLQLQRERALLREQERYVLAELSDAFTEIDRAYRQSRTNYNRVAAARQRLSSELARYQEGDGLLQFVLTAQSRLADAEAEYFRSLVDYNLAVAKVHYAQGTLLDYLGVTLSEGDWTEAAFRAGAKNSRRFEPRRFNYCMTQPFIVGRGPYQQQVLPRGEVISEGTVIDGSPVEADAVDGTVLEQPLEPNVGTLPNDDGAAPVAPDTAPLSAPERLVSPPDTTPTSN